MKILLEISVIELIGRQILYRREENRGYSLPLLSLKFSAFLTEMGLEASLNSGSFLLI